MKLYQIYHSTDKRKKYIIAHSPVQAENFAKEKNISFDSLYELSEKDLDTRHAVEEFYWLGETWDIEVMTFRELLEFWEIPEGGGRNLWD